MDDPIRYTVFHGARRLASGDPAVVAAAARAAREHDATARIAIFDDATGRPVDLDLRPGGEPEPSPPRGPGRPKLGVVAREVTLLPRHWDWLNAQPGGASVALRKLVDAARRDGQAADAVRQAREAAYRFMAEMAGDAPGFEEAARALFVGDQARFDSLVAGWPADVRDHARQLAHRSWW